jgi:hypothetical protein
MELSSPQQGFPARSSADDRQHTQALGRHPHSHERKVCRMTLPSNKWSMIMKNLNTLALASIAGVLLSSSAFASTVSSNQLNSVKAGISSSEVQQLLGKQEGTANWSNGTHSLTYSLKSDALARVYVDIDNKTDKVINVAIKKADY